MTLEGTVVNGAIVLDGSPILPEGARVRIELAANLDRDKTVQPQTAKSDQELPASSSLAARFQMLVERWRENTGMSSSVSKILKHPDYQEIIAMGEPALPLILRELRDRPNLWFPALKAIAKSSPVPPEQQSDPKIAREAWLTWGRTKGLIE
jgi:hypothetical protein